MSSPSVIAHPEDLHPSIWRASQLAHAVTRCVDTGHMALSNLLPGGGWPTGAIVELLVQQPGIGEMRLMAPALAKVAHRKIVMIQPPHPPHIIGLAGLGVAPADVVWVKTKTTSDLMWAAEQTLRSGSCGAVLLWANHIRPEHLRRLNLAAQTAETLFFVMRPLTAALDPSVSSLRLGVRPAPGGVDIEFVKRRGPQRDEPLFLPLPGHGYARPPVPATAPSTPKTVPAQPEFVGHS